MDLSTTVVNLAKRKPGFELRFKSGYGNHLYHCSAKVIRMRCEEFCTRAWSDVLRVYDGKSADDNLIDSYFGRQSIDVYFNTREIFISWSSNYASPGFNCTLSIEGIDKK